MCLWLRRAAYEIEFKRIEGVLDYLEAYVEEGVLGKWYNSLVGWRGWLETEKNKSRDEMEVADSRVNVWIKMYTCPSAKLKVKELHPLDRESLDDRLVRLVREA